MPYKDKEVGKAKAAEYAKEHPEVFSRNGYLSKQRRRNAVIDKLGGKCAHCGFSDHRALQIDHINGGGRQEYKRLWDCYRMCSEILRMEHPELHYQILCANCNWIKRHEKGELGNPRKYQWQILKSPSN